MPWDDSIILDFKTTTDQTNLFLIKVVDNAAADVITVSSFVVIV